MLEDLTELDALGWEALKRTLNQRVVATTVRFVPGKANRIWVVETDVRPVVVKRFLTGKCGNEFESLVQAKQAGLCVPMPLSASGDYLVLEYLDGENCERLINHMFSMRAADGIGEWLARYHAVMASGGKTKKMGDAVLSNFILVDGVVYAVDLEDSRVGDPFDDVGVLPDARKLPQSFRYRRQRIIASLHLQVPKAASEVEAALQTHIPRGGKKHRERLARTCPLTMGAAAISVKRSSGEMPLPAAASPPPRAASTLP
jgi:tRNA A-37 threonylcarbamoyl transferase component Bud32